MMQRTIHWVLGSLLFINTACRAETFQEGVDYIVIPEPVAIDFAPGQTAEVWSFFRYTCPGCYQFHPFLKAWQSQQPNNIIVRQLPIFQPGPYANAFFAAQLLDIDPAFHDAVYQTIHQNRQVMRQLTDFAEIAAEFGIPADDFIAAANSFSAATNIRQAESWAMQSGVKVTPTVIVNGRYLIAGNMVGSHAEVLEVVDFLLDRQ